MSFIRKPNQLAALQADYAALQEELTKERLRARTAESRLFAMALNADEEDAECPECEDLCALRAACDDSDFDVTNANNLYVNEFSGCNYWYTKFCAKGLSAEYECLSQLMSATVRELRYAFAVDAHNLAYCEAKDLPEFIAAKKIELAELMDANPDMDARCLAQVNKVLSCVDA